MRRANRTAHASSRRLVAAPSKSRLNLSPRRSTASPLHDLMRRDSRLRCPGLGRLGWMSNDQLRLPCAIEPSADATEEWMRLVWSEIADQAWSSWLCWSGRGERRSRSLWCERTQYCGKSPLLVTAPRVRTAPAPDTVHRLPVIRFTGHRSRHGRGVPRPPRHRTGSPSSSPG